MKSIVFLCLVASPWTTRADTRFLKHNRTTRLLRQSSPSLATLHLSSSNHGDRNQTVRIHPGRRAARLATALLQPIASSPVVGHESAVRQEPMKSERQDSPASLAALEQIDNFALYYWGTVLCIGIFGSLILCMRYGIFSQSDDTDSNSDRYSLYENIWALVLVASVGKAHITSQVSDIKHRVPVWAIGLIVTVLFGLQISAVILIVGSIDPNADPLTKKPGSPWLQHREGHTVNAMKVIMTIFLGASQIGEISQCRRLALVSWNVKSDHLLVPRWVPLISALMQYAVALSVVWSGVVVILSFATCLDIVYSSMSVVFITSGDEMFFDMFEEVCDVESDFDVLESRHHGGSAVHQRRVNAAMPINTRDQGSEYSETDHSDHTEHADTDTGLNSSRTDGSSRGSRRRPWSTSRQGAKQNVDWDEPMWLWILLKVLTIFPMFWAFGIMGRAMYTGIMPLYRLQHTLSSWKVLNL